MNAGLLLLQLALVARWHSVREAATFFVFWSLVWGGSVWLRFGYDHLIPKHVAAAQQSGDINDLGGMRAIATRTVPTLGLLSVPLLMLLLPGVKITQLLLAAPLLLLGAAAWAATYLLAGLARGYGRAGLFGWVQGVVPSGFAAAAVPLAHAVSATTWLGLAALSCGGLVMGAVLAFWMVARAIGRQPARVILIGHQMARHDRDTWPTGVVVGLFEVALVSPVWLASALGLGGDSIGALYAALRLSAAFTWLLASIVTVVVPLLAAALARKDYPRVGYLLKRSAFLGGSTMTPLAVIGALISSPLLGAVHPSYQRHGVLLIVLLAGRLLDASTGTLGEALLFGEHARWELVNQVLGALVLVVAGVALEPGLGVAGIAVAAAAQLAAINAARLVEIRWLFRHEWASAAPTGERSGVSVEPTGDPDLPVSRSYAARRMPDQINRSRRFPAATILSLVCAAAIAWSLADGALPTRGWSFFVALSLIVGVIALSAIQARVLLRSWRWVALSPLAIAAAAWLSVGVLRPLELYVDHNDTILPLLQLGYGNHDLTRAVSILALGSATWCIGYVLAVAALADRADAPRPVALPRWPSARLAAVPIGVGVLLCAGLFVQQGGPAALVNSPGKLHVPSAGGGYGQLGLWLVAGTALYALLAALQGGGATAKRIALVSAPIALVCTLSTEARGLAVAVIVAGLFVAVRLRQPSARHLFVGVALAAVLAAGLEFGAVVRTYSQALPPGKAVQRALQTPLPEFQTADLSTFDDLVAIQQLVPSSIPRLGGESLLDIFAAFVPRRLWPGKPTPVDIQVTSYLYPGATSGVPITMQGELFWNFGLAGVALGALVIGALMGYSVRLAFSTRPIAVLAYAVLFASTYVLLTRALATMIANTAIALVGVVLAYVAFRLDLGARTGGLLHASPRRRPHFGEQVQEPTGG